jgi:NAD(P)H-hydrate epimerase
METSVTFQTGAGLAVPAVTADQMREVDRIAVEDFGLGILQMMENAGRNLALSVLDMLGREEVPSQAALGDGVPGERPAVAILAGSGGNGGGGLCCARHLHNRGVQVSVLLSKDPVELRGAAANQLGILRAAGVEPVALVGADEVLRRSMVVVDALIGYSLRGAPRGRAAELIDRCNEHGGRVLSLDLPSGLDATTGDAPGVVVGPERTLTLALPKTGLRDVQGDLYLADIGIPPQAYAALGLSFVWPSGNRYWIRLET